MTLRSKAAMPWVLSRELSSYECGAASLWLYLHNTYVKYPCQGNNGTLYVTLNSSFSSSVHQREPCQKLEPHQYKTEHPIHHIYSLFLQPSSPTWAQYWTDLRTAFKAEALRNKGHQDIQQQRLHLEEIFVQPRTMVRLQEKAFVYQMWGIRVERCGMGDMNVKWSDMGWINEKTTHEKSLV